MLNKIMSVLMTMLLLLVSINFNSVSAKSNLYNTDKYNITSAVELGLPQHYAEFEDYISQIYYTDLGNQDGIIVQFKKEYIEYITFLEISSYKNFNGSEFTEHIATKKFVTQNAAQTISPKPTVNVNSKYITGVFLSCNTNYRLDISNNSGAYSDKVFIISVDGLTKPYCNSSVDSNKDLSSTNDYSSYDENFKEFPFNDTGAGSSSGENEDSNIDLINNQNTMIEQINSLLELIEQLKQELQNSNNKLQQLENILGEMKPIAINIEQSVYSIAQKQEITNSKLDNINNSIQSVENQLIPSDYKPIEKFNKNVEDLYSTDFVDNEVIKNDEIYYQEKELIDLEVPNIPVMDIEEWEGFSIEEEIEKDEVKNKDEVMEMDNFKMDQTLPQQKFEMNKPLEMQQFEIQQFEMDTFEQTNLMERDKPMVWGEKP